MFLFLCTLVLAEEVTFDWVSGFGNPANQVLTVNEGDTIKFDWSSSHNVQQMADSAKFTGCDFAGATMLGDTSPVTSDALTVGTHYYACSVGSHCASGQKLAVTVNSAPFDGFCDSIDWRGDGATMDYACALTCDGVDDVASFTAYFPSYTVTPTAYSYCCACEFGKCSYPRVPEDLLYSAEVITVQCSDALSCVVCTDGNESSSGKLVAFVAMVSTLWLF